MSLDFTILNAEGSPSEWIGLDSDAHERLMLLTSDDAFPLVQRASDYYAEVCYSPAELPPLLDELRAILLIASPPLKAIVASVAKLAEQAMHSGKPLHVLPD